MGAVTIPPRTRSTVTIVFIMSAKPRRMQGQWGEMRVQAHQTGRMRGGRETSGEKSPGQKQLLRATRLTAFSVLSWGCGPFQPRTRGDTEARATRRGLFVCGGQRHLFYRCLACAMKHRGIPLLQWVSTPFSGSVITPEQRIIYPVGNHLVIMLIRFLLRGGAPRPLHRSGHCVLNHGDKDTVVALGKSAGARAALISCLNSSGVNGFRMNR